MISEASIFAYLFFAYFYFSVQPDYRWPPGSPPTFAYSAPQTVIVLIGAATAWWANRLADRGAMARVIIALAITSALGAVFIALQFADWFAEPFSMSASAYGSNYFVISGFHLAHFVVGWVMFLVLLLRPRGLLGPAQPPQSKAQHERGGQDADARCSEGRGSEKRHRDRVLDRGRARQCRHRKGGGPENDRRRQIESAAFIGE